MHFFMCCARAVLGSTCLATFVRGRPCTSISLNFAAPVCGPASTGRCATPNVGALAKTPIRAPPSSTVNRSRRVESAGRAALTATTRSKDASAITSYRKFKPELERDDHLPYSGGGEGRSGRSRRMGTPQNSAISLGHEPFHQAEGHASPPDTGLKATSGMKLAEPSPRRPTPLFVYLSISAPRGFCGAPAVRRMGF